MTWVHAAERAFAEPDPAYGPVPIWWWSGDRLDVERLCDQLRRLADGGVRAAVVLNLAPSGPLHGSLADDPPFLSAAWWEIFRAVCAEADRIGFRLWFYDQLGFSGANFQAELASARPGYAGWDLRRVVARGSGPLRVTCPPDGTPVAAALVHAEGAVEVPVVDGSACTATEADGTLVLAYTVRRGFDYHHPEACAALRDRVHGAFERNAGEWLGSVLVGSFQDELPAMPTWSARFADEFARRRGYPLTGVALAALWCDTGAGGERVRYDYHRTRAELAEEAFFRPLYEWHERHGMRCGYDQQHPARVGEPVGSTELYADYPGAGRWYAVPGCDHMGDAKVHSGLSHAYARSGAWLEGFHSSGWGGTLEETLDWLLPWLRAGVTLYDPHAVYYATRAGWWEWAPPSTCWRQPYWPQYRRFAEVVARLCGVLSAGVHECDVAVLYPTVSVQAGLALDGTLAAADDAQREYLALNGSMSWLRETPGVLAAAGVDYDVIDDTAVRTGRVADGALRVAAEEYRTVLVPGCAWLSDDTAGALAALSAAGGVVRCVGRAPTGALPTGGAGWEAFAAALADGTIPVVDAADLDLTPLVQTPEPVLVRRFGGDRVVLVTAHDAETGTAQPMHGEWVFFDAHTFFDFDRYWREMAERGYDFRPLVPGRVTTLRVPRDWGTYAEVWDPTTGARHRVSVRADGTVHVPLRYGPAVFVVFRAEPGETDPEPDDPATVLATLPDDWSARVECTLDNTWGDLGPGTAPVPVQTWRFEHRTGDGWVPVVATFGRYAQVAGPCATADELPTAGWRDWEYSLSRGVAHDPLHRETLGPKGYVPEEFVHVDGSAGDWVAVRTGFRLGADDLADLHLAAGAPGHREIRLNGTVLPPAGDGYLTVQPVSARSGYNTLEVRIRSDVDGPVRCWWALTRQPERLVRPEWLTGAGPLRVTHRFRLDGPATAGEVQIGTEGAATIRLNGADLGRQGGFDPYAQNRAVRVLPYDVTGLVRPGDNELTVEFADTGTPALWVDGAVVTATGTVPVVSGPKWTDDTVRLRREQWLDPRWACRTPRPHPLPGAAWLDPAVDDGSVLPVVPLPDGTPPGVQWFRYDLPPGATAMRVPVAGAASVWWDRAEPPATGDGETVATQPVPVPPGARSCLLAVTPADGRRGGAVFTGPVEYETGTGRIGLGDWSEHGLSGFSGTVHYAQTIDAPAVPGPVWLDLGAVRGTAEVRINGRPVGELLWSPYRIRVDGCLRPGPNDLRVTVRNTLAPYLADASPTPGVFAGQCRSGLYGPVRLLGGPGTSHDAGDGRTQGDADD
ncbi:glycosylhydrolase-like jelly roll fold domain-containing protein [Actinocatenispora rupis]|uniref:Alpha-L-rhamnosidase n=1 Tax=Actinocatenispora rupis TaxID=519421 RepID=A0A8J3J023_9ACTN|nr:glycosylhydrolase-like jelly roll fold domain-containing protein [Actinocatenispora rupis]GID12030.1 hypothetical protein Aru02nite_29190 [Actinocatenispora rupis]